MQVSSDGLRSIIGKNVMCVGLLVSALGFVEHCIKPDQFGLGLSGDDRSYAECQSRLRFSIEDSIRLN